MKWGNNWMEATSEHLSSRAYKYRDGKHSHAHAYLLPSVTKHVADFAKVRGKTADTMRLFDLGCGNGSVAHHMAGLGWEVTGVDPSEEGISQANRSYPDLNLRTGSAYDDLAAEYGTFPVVLSLEVAEHVYSPRKYAKALFDLVDPGGIAIVSTPYHGYIKNLALAVTGKMDRHFTALWDHGHIKFWSVATLSTLLKEVGFMEVEFDRVGRVPMLAKSMIAVARKK